MARIALVDHSENGMAPNLILVLEQRGHAAMQFSLQDPAALAAAVAVWRPHLVCADLRFETIDELDGNKRDWWGVTILRLLKANPALAQTVLAADSKYIDKNMGEILDQLGIPEKARIRVFAANANLLRIAQRLEALLPPQAARD